MRASASTFRSPLTSKHDGSIVPFEGTELQSSERSLHSGSQSDTGTQTSFNSGLRVFSNDEIATQLNETYWEGDRYFWDIEPGDTLTVNIHGLEQDGRILATHALDAWEMVLGISFDISTSSNTRDSVIVFDDERDGAYATFSHRGGTITSAFVNVQERWHEFYAVDGDGAALNSYVFQTFVHEIGHVLGLGHPGPYNGSANFDRDSAFLNDSWQTSIMSYFHQLENPHVDASWAYVMTPMVADILAVQELYGVAGDLRLGDTTYGYNSNAGGYYDQFATLTNMGFTIMDDGGTDTFDTSGYDGDQVIRMTSESYSDVFGETGNVAIMRGTVLENAIGGSAQDEINGNEANNHIEGRDGDDVLRGAQGQDTIEGGAGEDILNGQQGSDLLDGGHGDDMLAGGFGSDTLMGGDGSDTLEGGGASQTQTTSLNGDGLLSNPQTGVEALGATDTPTQNTLTGDPRLDDLLGVSSARSIFRLESGKDRLGSGGTEGDVLYGGGGDDVFVFATDRQGFDRIADFEIGADLIDLSDLRFSDFDQLAMTDIGSGARLALGQGHVVTLDGVAASDLSADDFLL